MLYWRASIGSFSIMPFEISVRISTGKDSGAGFPAANEITVGSTQYFSISLIAEACRSRTFFENLYSIVIPPISVYIQKILYHTYSAFVKTGFSLSCSALSRAHGYKTGSAKAEPVLFILPELQQPYLRQSDSNRL